MTPPHPRPDLTRRLAKLVELGGLPPVGVRNDEWLYMLQEETRQSLSIEGYFATDAQLKAVLGGRRSGPEILNYFRAAQGLYDLALQYHREGEVLVNLAMIRHIHSELFRELDERRGLFRTGGIQISGAKVRPPEHDAEAYVRTWLELIPFVLGRFTALEAFARLHVSFEAIHPFRDGNGRVGRILLNYLAISLGWPPIIIKGTEASDRARYYAALEAGDLGFQSSFPRPSRTAMERALDEGDFGPMQDLLADGVLPQLDILLAAAVEATSPLQPLSELAQGFGVQEATLRQWVTRGQLVAVKRGRKLYSHSLLRLRDEKVESDNGFQ
ncbi:Fic family protein [Deinococcus alpinitundrae]|uniref:Fic family protein n=1 Tax=Deinococcus alpinitundrae TaxID=468913 RepID=UPI00137B2D5E|nr:Fic family protein [Deinococcus alpinitundrae]